MSKGTGDHVIVKRLRAEDSGVAHQAILRLKVHDARLRSTLTPEHLRFFLDDRQNVLIVAIDDGMPVGFALAYLLDRIDRDHGMMFFYEIEVADTHRRRGIGQAMVTVIKDVCIAEQVFKMWVHTNRSNVAAVALYRSTGGSAAASGDEVSFRYDFAQ